MKINHKEDTVKFFVTENMNRLAYYKSAQGK